MKMIWTVGFLVAAFGLGAAQVVAEALIHVLEFAASIPAFV